MTDISLIQYARLLGSNTVIGMAEKVGLAPPPPPISVRNLIDLAGQIILPLAPVDLQPQNGAQGVSNKPDLFFSDPGLGTPAAVWQFNFIVSHNNVEVGSPPLTGPGKTNNPLTPPGITWGFPLPLGQITLTVWGTNRAGDGAASTSTFTVGGPPPPPPPQPTITASIGSDDKVTVNGHGFNKSQTVNLQATVEGGISTPNTSPNNARDNRNQWPQTTADANGSFSGLVILPQNFMPATATFQDGTTSHVRAGETIAIVAKNANVSNFTPGPGVSNVVALTAPATV
jgi:hypothetical protein